MKNNTIWKSNYFYGNEVSNYGKEHGFVDYGTLAKSFEHVLNNNIISATGWENWEQENGFVDNSEEIERLEDEKHDIQLDLDDSCVMLYESEIAEYEQRLEEIEQELEELKEEQERQENAEIMQYYIISDPAAVILESYTNEIVFYNAELDMYVWGVTHWGTSWDYVLTDIKIELDEAKTA